VPCRFSLNLPLFGLGPSSKGLRTNYNLLTNKIAWIHWSLDLGPSSKVTRSVGWLFTFMKNIQFQFSIMNLSYLSSSFAHKCNYGSDSRSNSLCGSNIGSENHTQFWFCSSLIGTETSDSNQPNQIYAHEPILIYTRVAQVLVYIRIVGSRFRVFLKIESKTF
jgi:hypothetical protein